MMSPPDKLISLDHPCVKYPLLAYEKPCGLYMAAMGRELLMANFNIFPNRHLRKHFHVLLEILAERGLMAEGELVDSTRTITQLGEIVLSADTSIPSTLNLHINDALDVGEWFRGSYVARLERRIERMCRIFEDIPNTELIKNRVVASRGEALDFLMEVSQRQGMGIVLRNPAKGYKHGVVKVKEKFLFFFPSSTYTASQTNSSLDTLITLARQRRVAIVVYRKHLGAALSARLVEPYALVESKTGNLSVWCFQPVTGREGTASWKTFRLDRIVDVADTQQNFSPRSEITLDSGQIHRFSEFFVHTPFAKIDDNDEE